MIIADTYTLIKNDTNNTNELAAAVNFFFHEERKKLIATKSYVC